MVGHYGPSLYYACINTCPIVLESSSNLRQETKINKNKISSMPKPQVLIHLKLPTISLSIIKLWIYYVNMS
jgi:hypothetical protein